jgi:hypothetical protein
MDEERDARSAASGAETRAYEATGATGVGERIGAAAPGVTAPGLPKRFYGRATIEPVRMLRDLDDIADAVVAQLGRANAEMKITIEIEARAEDGFSDDVRRTVSENARTLKFESHEFEEG